VFRGHRPVRKWRLRGRRGQVSAVATILGLLLVVTFIANYLTATLPGQMSINDLNHVVQVENQVGRLSALLQAAAADNAVGAQLTQPVTLGSAGEPPFASADPGSIGPGTSGSSFNVTLPIGGAWSYSFPTIGPNSYHSLPSSSCTSTSTQVTCSAGGTAWWNVTEASTTNLAFVGNSGATGTYNLNIKDSGTSTSRLATVSLSLASVGTLNVLLIGNYTTVPLALSGAGSVNIEVVGNYDTFTITDTAAHGGFGGSTNGGDVSLFEVGLQDTTVVNEGAGLVLLGSIYGTSDSVQVTTNTNYLNAESVFSVYFTGDTPTTTQCPNDDNASSDYVSGGVAPNPGHCSFFGCFGQASYGSYNVTYNVTSLPVTPTTAPNYAIWESTNNSFVAESALCPLFTQASTPSYVSALGGGFAVHLASTYIPSADVAFDQGAVVYAQQGGIPILLDPPGITPTMMGTYLTSLSIWLPIFVGKIPVDSGLSTTEIESRLISSNTITFTSTSATDIAANNIINVTIVSPFAAAWEGFFNSTYPYDTFNYGCTGPTAACDGPYTTGGPLGTAWVDIATGARLSTVVVQTATFSVAVV